jgi:hypothetical protein
MTKFFKATPISTDNFTCPCGWRCESVSGDEGKAKARTDLLVRLHYKKCPQLQEAKKTHITTLTHSEKKGTTAVVNVEEEANKPYSFRDNLKPKPTKLVKHFNCKGSVVVEGK